MLYVDLPADTIDNSFMHSKGIRPGEELLHEPGMWLSIPLVSSLWNCVGCTHTLGNYYQKTDMFFLWNYSLKRGVDYTRHMLFYTTKQLLRVWQNQGF